MEMGCGAGPNLVWVAQKGAKVSGIDISTQALDLCRKNLERNGFSDKIGELVEGSVDILPFGDNRFDGIFESCVFQHLDKETRARTFAEVRRVLKPGGLVFVDASATRKKYELSTFMVRHIYPGNHSFFVLHDFMEKLNRTPFEILEVQNDRHSYFLTFRQWAMNLEESKDFVCENFGEVEYRKFRLYLWGAAYEFMVKALDCYRLILYLPKNELDWKR